MCGNGRSGGGGRRSLCGGLVLGVQICSDEVVEEAAETWGRGCKEVLVLEGCLALLGGLDSVQRGGADGEKGLVVKVKVDLLHLLNDSADVLVAADAAGGRTVGHDESLNIGGPGRAVSRLVVQQKCVSVLQEVLWAGPEAKLMFMSCA